MKHNYVIDFKMSTKGEFIQQNGIFYWKKFRYFYKGNIIQIRNEEYGRDSIIQLTESPHLMTKEEKDKTELWKDQRYACNFKFLVGDKENDPKKKRLNIAQRKSILARDNYTCAKCKKQFDELHIDHIKEYSWGGLSVSKNLITLCPLCHGLKGEYDKDRKKKILKNLHNSPNVSKKIRMSILKNRDKNHE